MVSSSVSGSLAGPAHDFITSPSRRDCPPVPSPSSFAPPSARPPSPFLSPQSSVCSSPSASPFRRWDGWGGGRSRDRHASGARTTYGGTEDAVASRRENASSSPSSDGVCSNSSCSCHDAASSESLSSSFAGEEGGSGHTSGTLRVAPGNSKNAGQTGNGPRGGDSPCSFLAKDFGPPCPTSLGAVSRRAGQSFPVDDHGVHYLQHSSTGSEAIPDLRVMSSRDAKPAVVHTSHGGPCAYVPVPGRPGKEGRTLSRVSSYEDGELSRWNAAEQAESDREASPRKLWGQQAGVPSSPTALRPGAASSPGYALLSTPGRGPLLLSELDTPFDLVRMNKGIAFLAGKHAKDPGLSKGRGGTSFGGGQQGPGRDKYAAGVLPFSPVRQGISEACADHNLPLGRRAKRAPDQLSEGADRLEDREAIGGAENWRTQETACSFGDKAVLLRDTRPDYSSGVAVSFGRAEEQLSPAVRGSGGRECSSLAGSRRTRVEDSDGGEGLGMASRSVSSGALSPAHADQQIRTSVYKGEATERRSGVPAHGHEDNCGRYRDLVPGEALARRPREPTGGFRQSWLESSEFRGIGLQPQNFGGGAELSSDSPNRSREGERTHGALGGGEVGGPHTSILMQDSSSTACRSSSRAEACQSSVGTPGVELLHRSRPRCEQVCTAGGATRSDVRTAQQRSGGHGSDVSSTPTASSVTGTASSASVQVGKVSPTSAAAQEILRSRQLLEAAERMLRGEKGGERTSRSAERHRQRRQSDADERRRTSEGMSRQRNDAREARDETAAKVRSHSAPLGVLAEGLFADRLADPILPVTEKTGEEKPSSCNLARETLPHGHELRCRAQSGATSVDTTLAVGRGTRAAEPRAATSDDPGGGTGPGTGLISLHAPGTTTTVGDREGEESVTLGKSVREREEHEHLLTTSLDSPHGLPTKMYAGGQHEESPVGQARGNPLLGSWLLVEGTEDDGLGSQPVPVRPLTRRDGAESQERRSDEGFSGAPGVLEKGEDDSREPEVLEDRRRGGEGDQCAVVRKGVKEGYYRLANSRCTTAGSGTRKICFWCGAAPSPRA